MCDHMEINTMRDYHDAVRRGPYAWPGGYPADWVTDDGETRCWRCGAKSYRQILWSLFHHVNDGWRVCAIALNYDDGDLWCCNCNTRIESAYAESEEQINCGGGRHAQS